MKGLKSCYLFKYIKIMLIEKSASSIKLWNQTFLFDT